MTALTSWRQPIIARSVFAVPAAIGVAAGRPHLRCVVLVGDGAFQMTGMELSTAARYGMNPIVIVFDNDGYGTERPMLDGAFNDVLGWNYARIPDVLGAGLGIKVTTELEIERERRKRCCFFREIRCNVEGDNRTIGRVTGGYEWLATIISLLRDKDYNCRCARQS